MSLLGDFGRSCSVVFHEGGGGLLTPHGTGATARQLPHAQGSWHMALGAGLEWPRPRALGWGVGQAGGQGPREGAEDKGGSEVHTWSAFWGVSNSQKGHLSMPKLALCVPEPGWLHSCGAMCFGR